MLKIPLQFMTNRHERDVRPLRNLFKKSKKIFSDRMKMFQQLGKEAIEAGGMMSLWQGNRLYVGELTKLSIYYVNTSWCLQLSLFFFH